MNEIVLGDAYQRLSEIPTYTFDCCVTSPPYWGQRDYECDSQIGIEDTPKAYLDNLVAVFSEVRRTLKPDGTLFLNIGDTYHNHSIRGVTRKKLYPDVKTKELLGIPWRLAFALQSNGWYLRQELIWHKPNGKPEPVKDRFTKSHEHLFLLTKSPKYYFNVDAAREPLSANSRYGGTYRNAKTSNDHSGLNRTITPNPKGRNRGSVWTISPNRKKSEHSAVMPEELARLCIATGSKEGGLILDPFSGSGTTAAVAKSLGRQYFGIEVNANYHKASLELLDETSSG